MKLVGDRQKDHHPKEVIRSIFESKSTLVYGVSTQFGCFFGSFHRQEHSVLRSTWVPPFLETQGMGYTTTSYAVW